MYDELPQRYFIDFTSYDKRFNIAEAGNIVVKVTKPRWSEGKHRVLMSTRSQALNTADAHLRKTRPAYANSIAWVLAITDTEAATA